MGAPVDSHTRVLLAGTLLDEWQIIDRVFVQAGLRVDKYLDLPTIAFSPRGAIVANLYSGGVTKAVGGRAFRAPNLSDLTRLDAARSLLERNPDPTEEEVRFWLAGNLCRCTGYNKIVDAVLDAASEMRGN